MMHDILKRWEQWAGEREVAIAWHAFHNWDVTACIYCGRAIHRSESWCSTELGGCWPKQPPRGLQVRFSDGSVGFFPPEEDLPT